jgi:RHS repeat-associated protein
MRLTAEPTSAGLRSRLVVQALTLVVVLTVAIVLPAGGPLETGQAQSTIPGQTITLLSDGRWLVVGGEDASRPSARAVILDPATGSSIALPPLREARAWHTATVLPDGTVLVFGGQTSTGDVSGTAEVIDPGAGTVELSPALGLMARARHSATLLTDGRLLIAGGHGGGGQPVGFAELLDTTTGTATLVPTPFATDRLGHTATLQPDGSVLITGGATTTGRPSRDAERLEPASLTVGPADPQLLPPGASDPPRLEATIPADATADVPTDAIVALRFSKPLALSSVHPGTISLTGPSGSVDVTIVGTEGGRLVFLTPRAALDPGGPYVVSVIGAHDIDGLGVAGTVHFTVSASPQRDERSEIARARSTSGGTGTVTATQDGTDKPGPSRALQPFDDFEWRGARKNGRPHSRWQDLKPLQARPGVTALAGQVLRLNGEPLAEVMLEVGEGASRVRARTDDTGRFLLAPVAAGHQAILIDGGSANSGPRRYGIFEVGVDLTAGETTVLSYTIWMPRLDTAHAVPIPSPTTTPMTITTPRLPGLELHLPAQTVIRDHEGTVVRELSITPIPIDRPPFPLPAGVDVPIYFTIQPGRAHIYSPDYTGAQLVYPNGVHARPGTRFAFWNYKAAGSGWYVYGYGTALDQRPQIVPDPKVAIYEFTGAMVADSSLAGPPGAKPAEQETDRKRDGEPVDLSTGLFVYEKTDLVLPDVIPITLRRTHRVTDTVSRAFGLGASHPYDIFLVGTAFPYTYVEVILPDGGRVHYNRISPGTGFENAVYEHTGTPTRFDKTRIAWDGVQWVLTFHDGTVYTFREAFGATRPMQGGLLSIRDRNGNTLTMTRNADGDLTRIMTQNGRWIEFSYDTEHRVTQAIDVLGRTVSYAYDGSGHLTSVTDAGGGLWEYTYDALNRMQTFKDARGIIFLTNTYDTSGKVTTQTQADGTVYQFAYTLGTGGKVTQTDVTDPRGNVRRVTFNDTGYPLTETRALATSITQTDTYERDATTNRLLARTDSLGRRSEHTYDAKGNLLSITRLAGTSDAVTTTFAYEPTFQQLASVTEPLNHTTSFGYDAQGNPTSITNALNQTTLITYDSQGRPLTIRNPLNQETIRTYVGPDLASVTDSGGNTTTRFVDAGGRLMSVTRPTGERTRFSFDALNQLTKIVDPLNGVTQFTFDPNGNLLSVIDARNNATVYGYSTMDRVQSRTDPLNRQESYAYDNAGNLTNHTSRKGQVTTRTYDALDRPTQVVNADGSTTTYTWDAGNRLTQIVDSIAGTSMRAYDGLDRLTSEVTPEGSVAYSYDAASRRTAMTAPGQAQITYGYDSADRLISITQNDGIVQFAYDEANRRISLTLPNSTNTIYEYDSASRITSLTYRVGTTVLGNLHYSYDASGRRTTVGGSWARTGLPQPVVSATYDAGNQQVAFSGQTLTYDLNGNLTSDGANSYTWNVRDQLVVITGPVSASFQYDGIGRRRTKTIDTTTTSFLHDGSNPVREQSGTSVTNLLTGPVVDEFFTRSDSSGTQTYFTDILGSIVALTDAAGVVQATYSYEAFGASSMTGVTGNVYDYTGRESDGTGLKYYRARYYHPLLQRFISGDPLGFAGGDVNLYAYVGNAPTQATDPFGLFRVSIDGGPECDSVAGRKDSCGERLPQMEAICITHSDGGGCNILGGAAGAQRWDVARGVSRRRLDRAQEGHQKRAPRTQFTSSKARKTRYDHEPSTMKTAIGSRDRTLTMVTAICLGRMNTRSPLTLAAQSRLLRRATAPFRPDITIGPRRNEHYL